MKKLLVCLVLCFSSLSYADMISVSITSTFNATGRWFPSNCEGCTQSFNISFQYDPTAVHWESYLPDATAYGLSFTSSGFLGSFTSTGLIDSNIPPYLPFVNQWGDVAEVDFVHTQTGVDVVGMVIWGCVSDVCAGAFGLPKMYEANIRPTTQTIIVPEPSSMALLVLAGLLGGLVSKLKLPTLGSRDRSTG